MPYPSRGEVCSVLDLDGRFLAPAFVDAHIHLESSRLWVGEFARVVVPRGIGTVVTDPHENANVAGLAGAAALVEATRALPPSAFFVIPSCVPASPRETSGAVLDAAAIIPALDWTGIVGLGEMMDFPGVLAAEADVLAKLAAARARGLPTDGHAPGVGGPALDTYVAAGPMQESDAHPEHRATWPLPSLSGMLPLARRSGSRAHRGPAVATMVPWRHCADQSGG
jgi:adenine deaminase